MIVICEECGKKYQVDEQKMTMEKAHFTCKSCGSPVPVVKPAFGPPKTETVPSMAEPEAGPEPAAPDKDAAPREPEEAAESSLPMDSPPPGRFSIRAKMFLLFFLIPIACMAVAGWLYVIQLGNLSSLITGESTGVVNEMAEDLIELKANTVARQCKIYMDSNHGLAKEDYNDHEEFRKIAVQRVGTTGYTALYAVPDSGGVWRTWAHDNPKIVGIDMESLKGPLGKSFPGFWKVFSGVRENRESRGYYTWQEKDGSFRDKFMVCVPVKGTPYVVAATTYMDEFTAPVHALKEQTASLTATTRNTIIAIMAGTILIIGLIVFLYGLRITGRIKTLTDVADRISVGELDAEIEVTANDEIGELGNAVSRMQESIRLSIERLRRR